ncbi:hypothetical protein F5Y13DRAFT_197434 [Hypoxylon sp. FL1857]|nr:hypothetical protein F5Y13DRAFT_197434 [Hypoxylon sp. FL1857]
MATSTIKTTWDTLPMEIKSMIIGSIMEPQDFRRAWFTCRQVSRSFKLATELHFRSHVLGETWIAVVVGGFSKFRVNGLPREYELPSRSFTYFAPFKCYSEDDAKVNFRGGSFADNRLFSTDQGSVPYRQIEVLMGRWLPITIIEKFLWGEAFSHYFDRIPHDIDQGVSLSHSGIIFELPYINHVCVDYEKGDVSIPYSPLATCLMARELALGEEVKLLASEDLEKTRWRASSPSIEKGLRIALNSEATRLIRFKTCIEAAIENVQWRRAVGRGIRCDTVGDGDIYESLGMDSWYNEWVRYISS